ncbi:MAG: hypothetical protein HY316_00900 [Acidobacteria bacterium]|nr:hypothetical protein [Acidobacteriota bacterium]
MQAIRSVTDDEVYHQFLKSEFDCLDPESQNKIRPFVLNPDFNDILQNFWRRKVLYGRRWPLLAQLPDPVEWRFGTQEYTDLEHLYIIKNCGWDVICPSNLLRTVRYPEGCPLDRKVRIERILPQVARSDFDRTLILIGVEADGPYTILDGNHRAVAMLLASREGKLRDANIPLFLGLSPRMRSCFWYSCP